jgi:hypothetical protein
MRAKLEADAKAKQLAADAKRKPMLMRNQN